MSENMTKVFLGDHTMATVKRFFIRLLDRLEAAGEVRAQRYLRNGGYL